MPEPESYATMQLPAPPSAPDPLRKPSRRWLLRGILVLLTLIALVGFWLFWDSSPLITGLKEQLNRMIAPLSSGFAQQNSPTASPASETFETSSTPSPTAPTPSETLVSATPITATPPHSTSPVALPNGWLILSLLDQGNYHLFAYQVATQKWLRLTNGVWDDLHPAVSPDGHWIAFTSNRERYWDLYLLSLQDGSLFPLTRTSQYDGAPTWSPDGKWLAYESYVIDPKTQEGNLEILIQEVNLTGSQNPQILQLTSIPGADFAPQWSPKGRQIAFISQRVAENDLWIADLDRIEDRYRNLSADTHSPVQGLSWSADGQWLLWNASDEGAQWIQRWDSSSPQSLPQKVIPGSQPILSDDGKTLFSVFFTPHYSYLQVSLFEERIYQLPLILLPSPPKGMTWLAKGFGESLPNSFQPLSSIEETFPLERENIRHVPSTPERPRLKSLEGVKAPFPYLHEGVLEAFQFLRKAIEERAGWDYLSRLENAYLPLSSPSFPSFYYEEWLYTGRAIALEPAALNAGWLVVVREEFGAEIYWRLYLKTRYQDGSQGMPLRELPFDLNARYSGNPFAYDQGGILMATAPSGYWIDLTELAQRYGWQRLPALSTWRTALNTARYSLLVQRDQKDWYSAMLELYPVEALYTATTVPSPTPTPTRTPFPTRTPTSTPTPSATLTPRGTPTLSSSPTPLVTP